MTETADAHLEYRRLVSTHWGAYELIDADSAAALPRLRALPEDPDPSPIGLAMLEASRSPARVHRPAVRAGWLERHMRGETRVDAGGRGTEPFIEVSWDEALDIVAFELRRVRGERGNDAIFGGSYGWSSAGRFHHAQSQIHRFLNAIGGYVRHVDNYSLGAGNVLMPHVVRPMAALIEEHHDWNTLAAHTRLFVSFGGVPLKNTQVAAGGASLHLARDGMRRMAANGCRFVNVSPVRANMGLPDEAAEWITIRPNTDTAVLLALATETILRNRHDADFLGSHCVGFERWREYLLGTVDGTPKTVEWASSISGVPSSRLRQLATELASQRSLVNVAWSLQRADHGEQPFWAAVGLAAVLGQIGLPGGGFGVGYGSVNRVGSPHRRFHGPTLAQGQNAVKAFIPAARIADLLLHPSESFNYNGRSHIYPDIRLIYWAGGNPFHHHQDLNRLARAWQRPETIIVNEQAWTATARMADIVLPTTTSFERDDIGYSSRDPLIIAMKAVVPPCGEARDDHAIFVDLARRLDVAETFTEHADPRQWLTRMYNECLSRAADAGIKLPDFDAFWRAGAVRLPAPDTPVVMLDAFRRDPRRFALNTPSGRIELFSETIAGFGLPDCPGHPAWLEPREWLGPDANRDGQCFHLISDQPAVRLHSQFDYLPHSRESRIADREPVSINPADAASLGIRDGDIVRLFNDRGACLAAASVTDDIMPGVLKLSTGAWWNPAEPGQHSLDKHGNPNVLTRDAPASELSQGCAAQSCLVRIERFSGEIPPVTAFDPPRFASRMT